MYIRIIEGGLMIRSDATLPLALGTEFRKNVDYERHPNIESSFS